MSDFRSFLKTSNTCARRSTVIKKSSKNENAVRKKISICDVFFNNREKKITRSLLKIHVHIYYISQNEYKDISTTLTESFQNNKRGQQTDMEILTSEVDAIF